MKEQLGSAAGSARGRAAQRKAIVMQRGPLGISAPTPELRRRPKRLSSTLADHTAGKIARAEGGRRRPSGVNVKGQHKGFSAETSKLSFT